MALLTGQLRGSPGSGGRLPGIALGAMVQTSFTEEVFFRGLLGPTLIRAWGFSLGNSIQALAFGVLHGLMFGPRVCGLVVGSLSAHP